MYSVFTSKYDGFYFIGIGGVSMSALAKYLKNLGKKVCGSDVSESVYTRDLTAEGIEVDYSANPEKIASCDAVVYTDAIPKNDPMLLEAARLKKAIISRGQLLYEVSRNFKTVIAVSGCHGKTTCTSMIAHIFNRAGEKFCAHIGGRDLSFGNYFYRGDDFFITEACEYKKNFLLLKPNLAVILNSDADHLECYGSITNLKNAYAQFAENSDVCASLYGDGNFGGVTFGLNKNADYSARNLKSVGGTFTFTAYEKGDMLGNVRLNVYGKHNVYNALAAIAAARSLGVEFDAVAEGLHDFNGVERRFERIGKINGAQAIADYAHHPAEIKAALRTAKKVTRGRLFVVFQPHTYSRTKNLFRRFVAVLSPLDSLMIYRTFAAREYYDDAGSALTLSKALKKSRYGDDVRDIYEFCKNATDGDAVLFLGAGDIYDIAKEAVRNLSPCR